jgi:hypothetical protein
MKTLIEDRNHLALSMLYAHFSFVLPLSSGELAADAFCMDWARNFCLYCCFGIIFMRRAYYSGCDGVIYVAHLP